MTDLNCYCTKISDLSPLKDMKLTNLNCEGTQVSDLSPLNGMPLTGLDCMATQVSDLSPLKDMQLTELDCGGTKVSDLSPLKGMPLAKLDCRETQVSDLSPLKGMPLTYLDCNSTKVSDLSPLKNLKLTWLNLPPHASFRPVGVEGVAAPGTQMRFKPERDAEILRSIKTLETINDKPAAEFWKDVEAQQATSDAWLKQVAALPADKQVDAVAAKLKERNPGFDGKVTPTIENGMVTGLSFISDAVTDITPVRALSGLKALGCEASNYHKGRLADLSPLKGMPLGHLSCGNTPVSDLSPLKGMPLTDLNCAFTPVSDLSPLKGMKLTQLYCDHTKVSDLSPLKGMPLKELNCDFKPERDAEILRSIKTLKTINDKPAAEFWKDRDAKKP